eukprot:21508-Heterococcus_DN1.PRE.3
MQQPKCKESCASELQKDEPVGLCDAQVVLCCIYRADCDVYVPQQLDVVLVDVTRHCKEGMCSCQNARWSLAAVLSHQNDKCCMWREALKSWCTKDS